MEMQKHQSFLQVLKFRKIASHVIQLLLVFGLFLFSLYMMVGSFGALTEGYASSLVHSSVKNPFIFLFIGILATAIVQSSSMTTTMVVLMVGAGELTLPMALPIIMGANVGTAITSTIISLGHILDKDEYGRAVAAASLHDIFNILTVSLVFVIEITTQALSGLCGYLGNLVQVAPVANFRGIFFLLRDLANYSLSFMQEEWVYLAMAVSLLMVYISIRWLSACLQRIMIGKLRRRFDEQLFGRPFLSLMTGFTATVAVQSSSVTTSLLVPLVATKRLTLRKAFPFIMGANVGTTSTALLAAMLTDVQVGAAALAVAFAHVMINLLGVLIFFPFKGVGDIPLQLAHRLGKAANQNRLYGVIYVVILFFLLPFTLIILFR